NTHTKADRIYRVLTIDSALGTNKQRVGITMPPLGPTMKENIPEVEDALRITGGRQSLLQLENEVGIYSESARAVSDNFFMFFDFPLLTGDRETALVEPYSIVLTRALADKIFKDQPALDQMLSAGGDFDLKVTGVMEDLPDNSHFDFDALVSLSTFESIARANLPEDSNQPIWLESWGLVAMPTYMLLKEGASTEDLEERLTTLCRENNVSENFDITLQPLKDVHLYSTDVIFDSIGDKGDIKNIFIFSAIVFLILLIAAVNYMNLSTARSIQRAKEVGMRKVVGSSMSQLRFQFIGESMFISFIAIILSIPLVDILVPSLNNIAGTSISFGFGDLKTLVLSLLAIWIFVGIVAGLYPAFILSKFKPVTILKGSFQKSKGGILLRKILIIFQFTLSISLIGLSIIIQQQMHFIQKKDLGYNKDQLIYFGMSDQTLAGGIDTFHEKLSEHTGIDGVARTSNLPGRTFSRTGVIPEGTSEDDIYIWRTFSISPAFIPTMDMKIAEGRNFDIEIDSDNDGVVLINQTAARQLGWETPIGKRIFLEGNDSLDSEVIGVVKDFHADGLQQPIEPIIIFKLPEGTGRTLVARIKKGQLPHTMDFIEDTWKELYPDHPFDYNFLDELFDNLYRQDIRTGKVVNIFSAFAIFIACLGLFGLASFSTSQRLKEIGIRRVMGASSLNITKLLVSNFLKWVALANIIALPLAWLASKKWLQGFAYKINLNVVTFILAALISIFAAIITVSFQSIKAAHSNPVDAIKYE
ncbi:MAG: ABC transporter permease, partial [Candidatus Celaenobacter antarcticus]|nr:ABC transporter permease [Candidatus Celaenobacter antarcticus]